MTSLSHPNPIRTSLLAIALLLGLLPPSPADGATFVVSTTADAGPGSLRQAIADANALAGEDEIVFALPGSEAEPDGTFTIGVLSALPDIVDRVTLDGSTQPGFVSSPVVAIDGDALSNQESALIISSGGDGSTIRGLSLTRFPGNGIDILFAAHNRLVGNYVGVVPNGTEGRSVSAGIFLLEAHFNVIGGPTASERNVVSASVGEGIFLIASSDNRIENNFIGTDAAGTGLLGNGGQGIELFDDASRNQIVGNLVAGNVVGCDVLTASNENAIVGNTFALNAAGGVRLINESDGNLVASNTIVENGLVGVAVLNGSDRNRITDNRIGVDEAGTPRGNFGTGVLLGSVFVDVEHLFVFIGPMTGPRHNMVRHNVIAHNADSGVLVGSDLDAAVAAFLGEPFDDGLDGAAVEQAISENAIFANGGLGIDLSAGSQVILGNTVVSVADGVTPNDPDDADQGANGFQNFPRLGEAELDDDEIEIEGELHGAPRTRFRIEFYAGPAADPSGHGEGSRFLGAKNVRTANDGTAEFEASFAVDELAPGSWVTATATPRLRGAVPLAPGTVLELGATSEFSEAVEVREDGD